MRNSKHGYWIIAAAALVLYAFSAAYFPTPTGASISNGNSITGGTCTNQFMRAISSTGAVTCATVQNADLNSASITVSGTTCTLGSSCTPSSGISGPLYSQIATVANTGSGATTMVDATGAQGSVTVASTVLNTAGNVLHIYASGLISTAVTPGSITFRVRLGSTNVCSGSSTLAGSIGLTPWSMNIYITSRTPGSSGTLMCMGVVSMPTTTATAADVPLSDGGGSFNTTGTLTFDLTTQWNAVASGDDVRVHQLMLAQL